MSYDLLIRNGRVIDGAGNPWYWGDVAVQGDRIAAIGKMVDAKADRVIDAKGMVVTPVLSTPTATAISTPSSIERWRVQ